MGYRSIPHAGNTGTLGTLTPGMSGRGVSRPVYQYDYEQDSVIDNEMDDYVDLLLDDDDEEELHKKIGSNYAGGIDTYRSRGSSQYYVGGNNVFEYAGNHRNYVRKGISPYKQPKHSGPPLGSGGSNQAFRTTGNFIGIGTQYGASRPHKILTDLEDDPVWDIKKIKDPMERSFLQHNNRVKKVLSLIKEYLNDEIN